MSAEREKPPRTAPVAPLVPVALAVMTGIVADRYGDPWGTTTWAAVGLAAGVAGFVVRRSTVPCLASLVLAFVALGGGWHHHRWTDLAPDDLARSVTETPRPAWVRGVLVEALGTRPGAGPDDSATTRFVLEVTGVNDGRDWRGHSTRGSSTTGITCGRKGSGSA